MGDEEPHKVSDNSIPRQYAMVKLDETYREIIQPYAAEKITGNLLAERFLIFLGEIPNMQGHCVLIGQSGIPYMGFHTDDFVELSEDEV